jgi:DNA-binding protein H-NS
MRYRDQVINKVEVLESTLKVLRQIVQRQEPVKTYLETIERAEEQLSQVKQYVEMEPTTSNEVGGFSGQR